MKLPMLSKTWQHVESIPQETNYGEISALSDTLSDIWMRSTVSTEPIKAREEGMYVPVFPDYADVAQGRISMPTATGIIVVGYRIGGVILWSVPSGTMV